MDHAGRSSIPGAQFIDDAAMRWHVVEHSQWMHGLTWTWKRWRERPATLHHPTGEQTPAVHDHDHCHICHANAFSERYDGDLREGWTVFDAVGTPASEQLAEGTWLCPECFLEYQARFSWTTNP